MGHFDAARGIDGAVGSWGEHTFDELAAVLDAALRDACNELRRAARRAQKEMRTYRQYSAAEPGAASGKLDRYEADLERRLYLAMNQLRALKAGRGAIVETFGANAAQNVAQNGPDSPQTPEKQG